MTRNFGLLMVCYLVSPLPNILRGDSNLDIGACSCRMLAWLDKMLYQVLCAKTCIVFVSHLGSYGCGVIFNYLEWMN